MPVAGNLEEAIILGLAIAGALILAFSAAIIGMCVDFKKNNDDEDDEL